MKFSIPIYIEKRKQADDPVPILHARPLFFRQFKPQRDVQLQRVLLKMARELRKHLNELARDWRQDELAKWLFTPPLEATRLKLTLPLRKRRVECAFLFVAFEALGRRLAFTPSFPELWFEWHEKEKLGDRARDVLTRHFTELEKENEGIAEYIKEAMPAGQAWIDPLDLDIDVTQAPPEATIRDILALFDGRSISGAQELNRVGRCLDWLYPDELDRAFGREAQVAELARLLDDEKRPPVLLLGPAQAGKTAIVHECVYRAVRARENQFGERRNTWLLSPQRLISGMSYLGQWENRLTAILKEAHERKHVLYFDDLVGLFSAGTHSQSNFSAAHLLKPHIERRECRFLGECTPEAFRVLRELDRGFADLFHVLPIPEPSEAETLRILIRFMAALEEKHDCRFDLEVLPGVMELVGRYVRDRAFPGKAARFLQQLAIKFGTAVKAGSGDIGRRHVLEAFSARSGLSVTFADTYQKLERREIVEALAGEIIGQMPAVEALANVIAVARARLNEPGRPFGTLLFLGPTGVGKTQCAKAAARYLFGDAERLLRFDMNEFIEPGSAARLVGTFREPEGLLTSVIRRQSFAVVLLDEIEKAHPEVFDLLLQVLGEGRLTDALGRTTDFGNAILILTSNLGVRAAAARVGYRESEANEKEVYISAAQDFFRPEFFNRLDHVVPFNRLTRADVGQVARHLIRDVFSRDGLLQRKTVLQIDPQAMERIIDEGYHPQLGARALKRAIERQITQPVAAHLAARPPGAPAIIGIYPRETGVLVRAQALTDAPPAGAPRPDWGNPGQTCKRLRAALGRIEDELGRIRPAERIRSQDLGPRHYRYYAIQEQVNRVRAALAVAENEEDTFSERAFFKRGARLTKASLDGHGDHPVAPRGALFAAQDMHGYLLELAQRQEAINTTVSKHLRNALDEIVLLETMLATRNAADRAILLIGPRNANQGRGALELLEIYYQLIRDWTGFECRHWIDQGVAAQEGREYFALTVEGPNAAGLMTAEAGTHLFFPKEISDRNKSGDPIRSGASAAGSHFEPVQVVPVPLGDNENPQMAVTAFQAACARWRDEWIAGRAAPETDPLAYRPVLRVYDQAAGVMLDLRSGLTARCGFEDAERRKVVVAAVRKALLAQLPLPAELLEDQPELLED